MLYEPAKLSLIYRTQPRTQMRSLIDTLLGSGVKEIIDKGRHLFERQRVAACGSGMKERRDIGSRIKVRRDIQTSFIDTLRFLQNARGQQVLRGRSR